MDMTKWRVGASAVLIVHLSAPPVFAQDQGTGAQGGAEKAAQPLTEAQKVEQATAKQKEAELRAANAETAAANAKVAEATAKAAAAAAEQAKENQDAIEQARRAAEAKRVIKYGVTVGAAAAVQIPLPSLNTLDEPAGATMPYVVFLPGFWIQNPGRNAYCAAEWSGPQKNAEAAADVVSGLSLVEAKRIRRRRYNEQALLSAEAGKVARELSEVKARLVNACSGANDIAIASNDISVMEIALDKQCGSAKALVKSFVGAKKEEARLRVALARADDAVETAEDDVNDASCWGHKVGFYVGYPVTFSATTDIKRGTAKNVSNRDVSPVISMGLALVPNAVVTILAGATLATAPRDDGTSAVVGSFAFGIGANADLVNVIP
ncbi:hypothetical protein WME94_12350 [Sorangium sp. So ce429]